MLGRGGEPGPGSHTDRFHTVWPIGEMDHGAWEPEPLNRKRRGQSFSLWAVEIKNREPPGEIDGAKGKFRTGKLRQAFSNRSALPSALQMILFKIMTLNYK